MTRGIPLLLLLAACAHATDSGQTGGHGTPGDTNTTDTNTGSVPPHPTNADHVVINEILSNNQSIDTDAAGGYDAWLELYNPTSDTVDLSTWALTDGGPTDTASLPWTFPHGTTLASMAFLLVWCDNETETSGLHADFTLSASGGDITLLNGSVVVDTASVPALDADTSYARIPDGTDQWEVTSSPTPGARNLLH